ncbi:MAG TPA: DoxX family protein [Bacteroidota bacterium]|nr:DoxX family protein [Bacteroidota bacterium]
MERPGVSSYVLSVTRVIVALLFMSHGSQKLFGFPPGPSMGRVDLFSLLGVAGVLEFFGGFLLLVGFFTRLVAFILSGEMAVAYFTVHSGLGLWPILNKGELAMLYCFVFLYFSSAGGGAWSLDAVRQ